MSVFGVLQSDAEELSSPLIDFTGGLSGGDADLATLDAKMLEAGIVHSGGVPPTALCALVDQLSDLVGQPRGITYEEIVRVNSLLVDPRVFARGPAAVAEKGFYLGHALIEDVMDGAVDKGFSAQIELAGQGPTNLAASSITDVTRAVETVADLTRHIGADMDPTDFAIFRPYLGAHPIRKTNGPSGKFSPGVPTLDLLLGGNDVMDYYPKLIEELPYYPRKGRGDIIRAFGIAQAGQSIRDLVTALGDRTEIMDSLDMLSGAIRRFRGDHYAAVGRQVPQALVGNAVGTGGELDPGPFLRQRMKLHGRKT